MTSTFPIALKLKQRRCLVVGDGSEAAARVWIRRRDQHEVGDRCRECGSRESDHDERQPR